MRHLFCAYASKFRPWFPEDKQPSKPSEACALQKNLLQFECETIVNGRSRNGGMLSWVLAYYGYRAITLDGLAECVCVCVCVSSFFLGSGPWLKLVWLHGSSSALLYYLCKHLGFKNMERGNGAPFFIWSAAAVETLAYALRVRRKHLCWSTKPLRQFLQLSPCALAFQRSVSDHYE